MTQIATAATDALIFDKTPLLEIVASQHTGQRAIGRALSLARQIGKTPIVVNYGRGFFTTRVIPRYLDEVMAMVGEGIAAATVEQAALQVGYPVGPLALVDEVSLTLNRRVRQNAVAASQRVGVDPVLPPAAAVVDRMIDDLGREGRAAGAGFYDYRDRRRAGLWAGLDEAFGPAGVDVELSGLQHRLLFSEALDAVRCLDEGVLRSVRDDNVGSLMGIGFPAWTGGVFHYVNQFAGGPAGFVRRARELADEFGEQYAPPESLVGLAARGGVLQ